MTGIDVGYKVVGGVQTEEVAIRVHVEKKKATVPKAQAVPAEIDGVVTDVLERKYELQVVRTPLNVAAQADTTHYATLQGGISIGPSRAIGGFVYSGTLGAIVTDNVSGQKAALTNFHVACVDSGWAVGDRQVQPSRGRHGRRARRRVRGDPAGRPVGARGRRGPLDRRGQDDGGNDRRHRDRQRHQAGDARDGGPQARPHDRSDARFRRRAVAHA